jgi:uncharacterized protein (DUF1778 family)
MVPGVMADLVPDPGSLLNGRTMVVQRGKPLDAASTRSRNRRIEVRATAEDRQLIDRAVIASGTDLTGFVITHLRLAAQQVLADREDFRLDPEALDAWERINERPARPLKGLRALMDRPSPFQE